MESVAFSKHPWANRYLAASMESAATASCRPGRKSMKGAKKEDKIQVVSNEI